MMKPSRRLGLHVLGVAMTAVAVVAHATSVIVPESYATIAAAVASMADTVLVRPGVYPESVTIARPLVLRGWCGGDTCAAADRPTIARVASASQAVELFDLHIVTTAPGFSGNHGRVERCRLDHGLSGGGDPFVLRSCQITGEVYMISGFGSEVAYNSVVGGGLMFGSQGASWMHDNVVLGPASLGIWAGEDYIVRDNVVRNCVDGIQVSSLVLVVGNLVEDCSGSGYLTYPDCRGGWSDQFVDNVARRCGGRGFDLTAVDVFEGNLVDSTGQEGVMLWCFDAARVRGNTVLRAGTTGIRSDSRFDEVTGNVVLDSGADGISLGWANVVHDNIVGRSRGAGIVSRAPTWQRYRVHHNTVHSNGGAGISLVGGRSSGPDSVCNNVVYGNASGLAWSFDPTLPPGSAPAPPILACNDWFANVGPDVVGTPPSSADASLNPLFCSLATDDVRLAANSPLLSLSGCGQVGARGVGCAANDPTAVLASLVSSRVVAGCVELEWQLSGAADLAVEVERSVDEVEWAPITHVSPDGSGRVRCADASVAAGARYGYRLAWSESGMRSYSAATFVTVPLAARFALHVVSDTRGGAAGLTLESPVAGEAVVEVFDVTGRRCSQAKLRVEGPGTVSLPLGRALAPGLYLARARMGGSVAFARAVVVR